jgi:hypothetical protein
MNPLETIEPGKLSEMESLVDNYYQLVKESETSASQDLMKFQDYELENNDTNIDLKALLNIS